MAKLMKVAILKSIASGAGIRLVDEPLSSANLYVIIDSEGNDLYVGKAASLQRHREEDTWKSLDYERKIVSGFVALMSENEGERRPFRYEPTSFDKSKLPAHINAEDWHGESVDRVVERLASGEPPTLEEVEQILIRIHVRAGCLIGNSQFGSQWEGPIGSFCDTMAVLATDAAYAAGVLPPRVRETRSSSA
ncbi:hypothetical protein [Frigoribacterium sp. PvP032]|uniref:hypothetical protein n=1 Tax=Frigoribacterium sp. PvP032 TaxID=2806589 RepID=UPI001AE2300E|nr:hypothetical protein [Frigoribacterium sp. PvP032]MBP1191093.1 hypothetical protein [Frigoribacterium sp. PvP032]